MTVSGEQHRIMSLEQVLALVDGQVPLLVEVKSGDDAGLRAEAVARLWRAMPGRPPSSPSTRRSSSGSAATALTSRAAAVRPALACEGEDLLGPPEGAAALRPQPGLPAGLPGL